MSDYAIEKIGHIAPGLSLWERKICPAVNGRGHSCILAPGHADDCCFSPIVRQPPPECVFVQIDRHGVPMTPGAVAHDLQARRTTPPPTSKPEVPHAMTDQPERHYESDAAPYDEEHPDLAHENPADETTNPDDTVQADDDDPDAGDLPDQLPPVPDDEQFPRQVI